MFACTHLRDAVSLAARAATKPAAAERSPAPLPQPSRCWSPTPEDWRVARMVAAEAPAHPHARPPPPPNPLASPPPLLLHGRPPPRRAPAALALLGADVRAPSGGWSAPTRPWLEQPSAVGTRNPKPWSYHDGWLACGRRRRPGVGVVAVDWRSGGRGGWMAFGGGLAFGFWYGSVRM